MEPEPAQDRPFQGLRILVADDEFLIACVLEDMLSEAGAEIVSAQTLATALQGAADAALSAAVLDVRLGRQTTEAVADVLQARGLPFIFYSGQALPDSMHRKFSTARVLAKPTRQDDFMKALIEAVHGGRS